jgi:hypothetical protein
MLPKTLPALFMKGQNADSLRINSDCAYEDYARAVFVIAVASISS